MLIRTSPATGNSGGAQPQDGPLLPSATRARSVAARDEARISLSGSACSRPSTHGTTTDGRVYAVVASDSALGRRSLADPDAKLPGMLVVTDLCPIRVPDRVRGTAWLTGWLSPVPVAQLREAGLAVAAVRPVECLLDVGDPPLRVLFTSSRRFPRSRRNPGPLLNALHGWLEEPISRPLEAWLR